MRRKLLLGAGVVVALAAAAVGTQALPSARARRTYEHGIVLADAGDHAAAIRAFGDAATMDHRLTSIAYTRMGGSYLKLGQKYQAIVCLRHALELDPANVNASVMLTRAVRSY